ncbi:MAG: hypothetical protein ACXADX_11525 [Candidatus Hodarchaeales archaeon]|jgi:hypothetical protein
MDETATSINNVRIRLPVERWQHITKRHQLNELRDVVLKTIQDPEKVYRPISHYPDQFMAVNSNRRIPEALVSDYLLVHYKEVSQDDGFVITAHLISNRRFERMIRKWKRVYP